jgi:hypothetical protein
MELILNLILYKHVLFILADMFIKNAAHKRDDDEHRKASFIGAFQKISVLCYR